MKIPGICCLAAFLCSCSYLPEAENLPGGIHIEENRDYILLEPQHSESLSPTGLIFYPGGLVDPHAYENLAASFALSGPGHRVLIAKMPSNLAVLDLNAAKKILKSQNDLQWVIGGHSLGGAMSCSLISKETDLVQGLVLMASYPAESADLSSWGRPVLSISASEDRIVNEENFIKGKDFLPAETSYRIIEGGNHSGFGQYGSQEGDGIATISQEEQHRQAAEFLQTFFDEHGLE